jgi:hypothetical protein
MKFLLAILTVLSVWWAADRLEANPAKNPKRKISGQPVNLTPLLNWWAWRDGDRPLPAWVRVTGRVVGTNTLGWTVEGTVETPAARSPSDPQTNAPIETRVRVVLKNPPVADRASFQQLTEQIRDLNEERVRVASAVVEATNQVQELSERRVSGKMASRVANVELNQWRVSETDAKDRLAALDEQLKELDARLADYPDRNHYEVDCFALTVGQQLRGLPVYDHGTVVQ